MKNISFGMSGAVVDYFFSSTFFFLHLFFPFGFGTLVSFFHDDDSALSRAGGQRLRVGRGVFYVTILCGTFGVEFLAFFFFFSFFFLTFIFGLRWDGR